MTMQSLRPALWSTTPPAIFTPILGLLGLGLAWRRAAEVTGAPAGIGEAILGAVALLWLFAVITYLAKLARRPSTLVPDLRPLPGRAGLAAAGVSGMVLAAALLPYRPGLAAVVLVGALIWQAGLVGILAYVLATGPAEQRLVTPIWHLTFVGFIVAPLSAVGLGWLGLAKVILAVTIPMAAAIYVISVRQLLSRIPPAPLRPILAIHLAPLCLAGLGTALLGWTAVSLGFAVAALAVFALLLAAGRWIAAAGFTPFWGAFTFPLAAFSNLMLLHSGDWAGFRIIGLVCLVVASIAIPVIAFRILKLWPGGKLSAMTNAARA